MHAAYDPELWHDFAVAVAGAGAALAGLLVVAVSVNVREVIAGPTLTRRAGLALVLVTVPLVLAVVLLIPSDSPATLGSIVLLVSVAAALVLGRLLLPPRLPPQRAMWQWWVSDFAPAFVLAASAVLAGIGLAAGAVGGLYWLPVAVIAGVLGGLVQAWVLLIEILR